MSSQRKDEDFTQSQGEFREEFDDLWKEEDDRQCRRESKLKSQIKEAEWIDKKQNKSAKRERI